MPARYSQKLLGLLGGDEATEIFAQGAELIRRRRVLDFSVGAGMCSARVQLEQSPAVKVEVKASMISDELWGRAFEGLAQSALLLAELLSGEISNEVEDVFKSLGCALIPESAGEFKFEIEGAAASLEDVRVAAVLQKFAEAIAEDPFLLLLFRGRGRDEALLQIRKHRRELQSARGVKQVDLARKSSEREQKALIQDLLLYFSAKAHLFELAYSIRADELPAAILKWLDPLPLDGLEDEVEFLFEEAYAQVARRAQAFGLGLS